MTSLTSTIDTSFFADKLIPASEPALGFNEQNKARNEKRNDCFRVDRHHHFCIAWNERSNWCSLRNVRAHWLRTPRSPNLAPHDFCFWDTYTNEGCLKNITISPEITDKITAVMNAILTTILRAELTQIFCVTVTSVYNPAEGTETHFPYKSFRAVPQLSVHFSFNVIREINCRKYLYSYNWINQLSNTTIWWLDICCLLHRYQLHVSSLMAIFRLID